MFIKKSSESDFFSSLEDNLQKVAYSTEDRKEVRDKQAVEYLKMAADLLDDSGLKSLAKKVASIVYAMEELEEEYSDDPATKGLTSEKMLRNLEEKGWVFYTNDENNAEDKPEEIEIEITLEPLEEEEEEDVCCEEE